MRVPPQGAPEVRDTETCAAGCWAQASIACQGEKLHQSALGILVCGLRRATLHVRCAESHVHVAIGANACFDSEMPARGLHATRGHIRLRDETTSARTAAPQSSSENSCITTPTPLSATTFHIADAGTHQAWHPASKEFCKFGRRACHLRIDRFDQHDPSIHLTHESWNFCMIGSQKLDRS